MVYEHVDVSGRPIAMIPGKVVCVGRNYAEHARELGNAVPEQPILFMKPSTALVGLDRPLVLPQGLGACHHELELAVLVGRNLSRADPAEARDAAIGFALALDLTLRDLQQELKTKGQPWERAKAFDGACPLSPFAEPGTIGDPQSCEIWLDINGERRQQGNTRDMVFGIWELMAYMSGDFTLRPGDVVLTGTPAGVGPLASGDRLEMGLAGRFRFQARVA